MHDESGRKRKRNKKDKENFQIITCICPFDCPQICQPHSPSPVPSRLSVLGGCCGGLLWVTPPWALGGAGTELQELVLGQMEKSPEQAGQLLSPKQGGGECCLFHSLLQKRLAVLKNFPLFLLCMRVGLQSSANSSRIQQEILPGASVFELCLLRPRQRGRVWKAKCS